MFLSLQVITFSEHVFEYVLVVGVVYEQFTTFQLLGLTAAVVTSLAATV